MAGCRARHSSTSKVKWTIFTISPNSIINFIWALPFLATLPSFHPTNDQPARLALLPYQKPPANRALFRPNPSLETWLTYLGLRCSAKSRSSYFSDIMVFELCFMDGSQQFKVLFELAPSLHASGVCLHVFTSRNTVKMREIAILTTHNFLISLCRQPRDAARHLRGAANCEPDYDRIRFLGVRAALREIQPRFSLPTLVSVFHWPHGATNKQPESLWLSIVHRFP